MDNVNLFNNTSVVPSEGKAMLKEFKEFAVKGNVVDMAVGVIIGAAFGKIVTSVVNQVIMPPLGLMTGNVDFSNKGVMLDEKAKALAAQGLSVKEIVDKGGSVLQYGAFINTVVDFVLVAIAIFVMVKLISRMRPPPPPPPPATKDCPQCAMPVPVKALKCGHCLSQL